MGKTIYQVVMYKQNGSLIAHRNVLLEAESLEEANKMLLNLYNELFGEERGYASTWHSQENSEDTTKGNCQSRRDKKRVL